jgi:hypothetical protein
MKNLLPKIESVFNECKLIGDYDFSDEEYSLMVERVSYLCFLLADSNSQPFKKEDYKLIFATLVEISKRWKDSESCEAGEDDSRFWDYIDRVLSVKDFPKKIYSGFTDVILSLRFDKVIPAVTVGKLYYATLMMHSFSPRSGVESFFDLCYNVYKKDLCFGYTSEDKWVCEIVAEEMRKVLRGAYREDKKVSIGSNAYSIKVGIRSMILNSDLSSYLIDFIDNTFSQINRLFDGETIEQTGRLKRFISEWWKKKSISEKVIDGTDRKKRVSTVSKREITVKYFNYDGVVVLSIPPIRADDFSAQMWLSVYVNGEEHISQRMGTKCGELVVATIPITLSINDLSILGDTVDIKVTIKENGTILFDSESNNATSLKREFIVFDGEKEVLRQNNKPNNYFLYSRDVDTLKSLPAELSTMSSCFYNIYPIDGESIIGKTKQMHFIDDNKLEKLGKRVCLIGSLSDIEWRSNNVSYIVYKSSVKLMIPQSCILKALKLTINDELFTLSDLKYEKIESGCYQFGLKALGLISENKPLKISLFSYEEDAVVLSDTIIILSSLSVQFNYPFYYGDLKREVAITYEEQKDVISWGIKDNEVLYPLREGYLVIAIPYFKWRINQREWNNEQIGRIIWYKDIVDNVDCIEVSYPKGNDIVIMASIDEDKSAISRNIGGKYEIGKFVYCNQGKEKISFSAIIDNMSYEMFSIATKEYFVDNPIKYVEDKILWDVENTFIGDAYNEFFLIAKQGGKNDKNGRIKVGSKNQDISILLEGVYEIIIKIKNKDIIKKSVNEYEKIWEGSLIVGDIEKYRFYKKKLLLICANCYNKHIIRFVPRYYVDRLEYYKEDGVDYYRGRLYMIKNDGEILPMNLMMNEERKYDRTNPVKIELRDSSTMWLTAGCGKEDDSLGDYLFCNINHRELCNITKENSEYSGIDTLKFKEEQDV